MSNYIKSACLSGIHSIPVTIEVQTQNGLPRFSLIGLGDNAIKESRERVLAALSSIECTLPDQILINLSPAEEKKSGASLDLAIAIAIANASGLFDRQHIDGIAFIGELSLSGKIRPIRGAISHAIELYRQGIRKIVCPISNIKEVKLLKGIEVIGFSELRTCVEWLQRGIEEELSQNRNDDYEIKKVNSHPYEDEKVISFDEIVGQEHAKRALLIAACGGHHIIFSGPPGCGKTMLAQAFRRILPPLSEQEILETASLHSVSGLPIENIIEGHRPFRSPHYNISEAALIGGGSKIKPGEVSLSHRGVLFLDELPEFPRNVIEALRIPLENGSISVSRALGTAHLPARFTLIAAMNPCPCGKGEGCQCSALEVQRYVKKISEPILDRIDMRLVLRAVPVELIIEHSMKKGVYPKKNQNISFLQNQIVSTRSRLQTKTGKLSCQLSTDEIMNHFPLESDAIDLLEKVAKKFEISSRGINRILRVASTITVLSEDEQIKAPAVAEALSFRN
jgi:magnesium chelatase family protein